jgi:hypothetical protein
MEEIDGTPSGWVKLIKVTNTALSISGSDATLTVSGVAPGTGSMTTVEEQDTQIGDADMVVLDFQEGFSITESPDTEVNISLDVTPSGVDATLQIANDAIQVKPDTTDLEATASGLALAASPTITGSPTIGTAILPDAADGAVIGSATAEWSDAYFADAAVIYLGADQDVDITHVADVGIKLSSVAPDITLEDETAGDGTGNLLFSSGTAAADIVATLQVDVANSAVTYITLDGTNEQVTIGPTPDDNNVPFAIQGDADSDAGGDTTDALTITLTGNATPTAATWGFTSTQSAGYTFDKAVSPSASDGAALGTTALEWSDIFIADAGVIDLGDDQDVTITHVADVGITLASVAPDITLVDDTAGDGTGNLLFSTANAGSDIVATIQADIANTATTFITLDGTNEKITLGKFLDTFELGHVSDTTIARVSAGVVSIEGKNIYVVGGTDVADADVVDTLTASNYLPLAGGTLTGEVVVDNLGLEFTEGTDHSDCSAFAITGGGIFYDDTAGKFKKCQDNVLTDLDTDTGANTVYSSIADPTAAGSISFDDTETATYTSATTASDQFIFEATGAFGNISIFKIEQKTGNATDGDLLQLLTADADVDHLLMSYGAADYVTHKIVDAGTYTIDVTSDGTAAVDIVDGLTAGSLTSDAGLAIADGGNIGSATDADSIAIDATGNVTFSQNVVVSGTGIELNHATANTLTASGGVLSIEGNVVHHTGGADITDADIANDITITSTGTVEGAIICRIQRYRNSWRGTRRYLVCPNS